MSKGKDVRLEASLNAVFVSPLEDIALKRRSLPQGTGLVIRKEVLLFPPFLLEVLDLLRDRASFSL